MSAGPLVDTQALNQSPPFVDVDLYALDLPLQEAVRVHGAGSDAAALSAFSCWRRRWAG